MKRMTKNLMRDLLKDDNYNECLAYMANRIATCKGYCSAMTKLEKDYDKIQDWVDDFEDDDSWNDYSDNLERVYTAVFCIIDREF